ncbi:hypothetical protein SAMN02746041_02371 [Desulfacinum hydrothermale DSM 13146]|uniref:Uncharacterized protein n=1 Tax=Desulfacinum hydrothermale DSM 13146 TaxID=1121390 RepID=A0A1W1XNX4_9BACT|nr:hypothetical protein [Desulfacinum hydrothermale]SMC25574.1 hypothetical protein SAMN02746041_02371 [Desulfacinum hydrothermale DSM 13146]
MKRTRSVFFLIVCVLLLPALAAAQVDYPEKMALVVAQYPGSTVEMAMQMQQRIQVMLRTQDEPEKVFQFYKEALSNGGWESQMELIQKEGMQSHWTKGDQAVHVVVSPDEGKTGVMLMLGSD